MKQVLLFVLLQFGFVVNLSAQQSIQGVVLDEASRPLSYANVFIKETFEGTSSDENGLFTIKTTASGMITLSAMVLGYETYSQTIQLPVSAKLTIKMKPTHMAIDEVEVVASTYQLKGNSQWSKMNAVDLVTTGGSNGDLYKSIETFPGAQVVGDGKLYIRGGESREAQTYIDDMHVLVPYTTSDGNEPVRGRYSPFMFEGVNFSLGGYDPEYSQGLSSILPLSTKDKSPISKYGTSISSVGVSGGGTHAYDQGSTSLELDYQNLAPYYSIIKDSRKWNSPYQKYSGAMQSRFEPDDKSTIKLYGGYDRTSFGQDMGEKDFGLKEDNYYLNSTYKRTNNSGYTLFAGAAYSYRSQRVNGAMESGDFAGEKESELHLKAKVQKRFSRFFKLQTGAESMIRLYGSQYEGAMVYGDKINHSINGLFATGSVYFSDNVNMALSSRAEYTSGNQEWNYIPRVALNYKLQDYHLSLIAGRYTQLTTNDYLLRNRYLPAENCTHYITGAYHQTKDRIYRLEAYYKQYDKLATVVDGQLEGLGDGYSKGIDAFFNDASLLKNFEYRIAYSLNYSERRYRGYPVKDVPQFATRHNASVSFKYTVPAIKSIIGITNRFASGRPYHNPNEEGFMNSKAPNYNSLDLSFTYLANKKLIIFASASNILGRTNIYNYSYSQTPDANGVYRATPVKSASNNFFFIGVFITLGGNTAYDVSNF